MSVYHSIQEYIHRYAKHIRVYTRIYFVEVVYVRISQYIEVYIQIFKVHMSISEYILFWSSICPYILQQYIGVYTQICKVHTSILVYEYILCWSSICPLVFAVCEFTVEWESELFRGTMLARCYPFDMPVYTMILLVCPSPAFLHVCSATKGWKIA